eukprot:CAMPEP_0198369150 /NCGR_PEP_ID=MMETSP1450-20131203/156064_1 /TAXON_ID=753684 ORGANISM="Madagascaria erythrocladiodes, Strain CCMP3234" /NCGR_SAMPLE_ID=MMETSP1450 /ASSEMBLY_ACC=CAM_ASM_001115 /LENGTH=56 /DNA_ID=CAMNT_0044076669 /DNA_START=398 /DNA_END=568 /DNA_ORIENTATION=+
MRAQCHGAPSLSRRNRPLIDITRVELVHNVVTVKALKVLEVIDSVPHLDGTCRREI